MPQTGASNNRHSFLTILENGKFKIKVLANLISGESLSFWLVTATFFLCPHRMREGGHMIAIEQETEFSGLFLEGH